MHRTTVNLEPNEHDALWLLCKLERRAPELQAALLIRQQLERLGLLEPLARTRLPESTEGRERQGLDR